MRRVVASAQYAAAAVLLLVGCSGGCSQPSSPAGGTSPRDTAGTSVANARAEPSDAEEIVLPVLNDEALSARTRAQRQLLGKKSSLFEGADGKPVPWISPSGSDPEGEQALDDALLDMLPGSAGLGAMPSEESSVNGNALGLFVPIEAPEAGDTPLAHFHRRLSELREGKRNTDKVRVLVYGASHTDADIYTEYLRSYLQERFGDGGHGFIHVAKPWRWYRHVDMLVESSRGWLTEHAQRRKAREDGLFGLLGCSMSSGRRRDYGRVRPRNGTVTSHYEIYYLSQPKGGSFKLKVDGKKLTTIKTKADSFGAGYHSFHVPEGEHEVEIRPVGNGEVRLFGMTAERKGPGVVVDTLGIGGTRASNQLKWDESVWADNLAHRAPDLYVLAYGTNETMDEDQPIDDYAADLRAVLERFQVAAPRASCLLVGPGDFPRKLDEGGWAPRPRLVQIVTVQRNVAAEMGCGFWDTLAFMGGPMSMPTWVASRPPMARTDGVHFTRRGYVRMGMGLTDALMVDFDSGQLVP